MDDVQQMRDFDARGPDGPVPSATMVHYEDDDFQGGAFRTHEMARLPGEHDRVVGGVDALVTERHRGFAEARPGV